MVFVVVILWLTLGSVSNPGYCCLE